tara:strand:+ start:21433 stop:22503 length:1071 start_codon:yes stop_codon:yes gene_type:complete
LFLESYRGKRIFVTGHTGFKGSWLCLWLKHLGAEVEGYALKPRTKKDNYIVSGLRLEMGDSYQDIRDYSSLKESLIAFSPELIFHLAAQPLVRESYAYPRETFDVNVMGTINVLDIARNLPELRGIVNITSDKCYENNESGHPFKESDPMGGHDPYSASKGAAELASASYRSSFFKEKNIMVSNVRAGNVIGGGDWCKDRIVTDTILACEEKRPVELRNPNAIRPWQHVLEPLSGYLQIGSKAFTPGGLNFSGGWNFGPSEESHVSVRTLVTALQNHLSFGEIRDISDKFKVHEAQTLRLDISKAKTELGWSPQLDLNTSAQWTAQWYQKLIDQPGTLMKDFTLQQIEQYQEKLEN